MPSTIDQAIEALRKLSPARQEELAGYICHLAADEREPEDIDPAHLPAVHEGLAQLERGERATPEQVEAAFRSFDE
jgi:hypothetical protein